MAFTTLALGEESSYSLSSDDTITTLAIGEEDEPKPTTLALGEEDPKPTTLRLGEEDGGVAYSAGVDNPFGAF